MILAVYEARRVNWIWSLYREKSSQQVRFILTTKSNVQLLTFSRLIGEFKLLSSQYSGTHDLARQFFQHPTFSSISIFFT